MKAYFRFSACAENVVVLRGVELSADAQLGRRSLNLRCMHAFGLIILEPALRQYVATERFATPACDLDVECLHKVRSSVADHISKE